MGKKLDEARPSEKIVALYSYLLFNRRKWSLIELTHKLNCSKPTVGRLIDQLEGIPYLKVIKTKQGRECFYELDRSQMPPEFALNGEGLFQLSMGLNYINHLCPESFRQNMEATLIRASAFIPSNDLSFKLSGFCRSLTRGSIDYTPFQDIYRNTIGAIILEKVCEVGYQSSLDGPIEIFDYGPKLLSTYHETIRLSGWRLNQRDQPEPDKPICLSLHRLKFLKVTERNTGHLSEPVDQNLGTFGIMGNFEDKTFEVTICFKAKVALYVAERQWSSSQKIDVHSDKSLTLIMTVQSSPEILKWVLSFGQEAEVLSPQWLRKQVVDEARQIVSAGEKGEDDGC